MNSVSQKTGVVHILIGLFLLVIVFHLLITTGVIPFSIVWGGRLGSKEEMYRFETVSLLINAAFVAVLWIKKRSIREGKSPRWVTGILWFFLVLFVVNTIGNLFAESLVEKLVFTPITFISAVLIYLINK